MQRRGSPECRGHQELPLMHPGQVGVWGDPVMFHEEMALNWALRGE